MVAHDSYAPREGHAALESSTSSGAEDEGSVSDLEYRGTATLTDVLVRADDMEPLSLELHDCRTDPNRTGCYRLVQIPRTDKAPVWVFDPMQHSSFLYISNYCQFCGKRFEFL